VRAADPHGPGVCALLLALLSLLLVVATMPFSLYLCIKVTTWMLLAPHLAHAISPNAAWQSEVTGIWEGDPKYLRSDKVTTLLSDCEHMWLCRRIFVIFIALKM
jgi:hypothetical protein